METEGWQHEIDGQPWTLLSADEKLFVVTTGGKIYCFGAGQGEPIAYLTGEKEFYSLSLSVTADVLIPRRLIDLDCDVLMPSRLPGLSRG